MEAQDGVTSRRNLLQQIRLIGRVTVFNGQPGRLTSEYWLAMQATIVRSANRGRCKDPIRCRPRMLRYCRW